MRPVSLLLLAACLAGPALPPAAAASQAPLSYDAMFSPDSAGRIPTAFAWAPEGRRLAYLWDDGQGETLWLLDPANAQAEAVVRPADLPHAGQSADKTGKIDALQWSPRGDALLLQAGGHLYLRNLQGLGGRELRRLTATAAEESDAKFSPDGGRVAFVRGQDLYLIDLATGAERALTSGGRENAVLHGTTDWLYWEEVWDRAATGYWWSPDGQRIAYYEFVEGDVPSHPLVDSSPRVPTVTWQRYPQPGDPNPRVRVGVLDLASGQTAWMQTGDLDQYLARVVWTPDSRAVAIEALSRAQTRLDLLRCGAGDGRCATLLTESAAAWLNVGNDLRFLPDGLFLWASERSGWRRLYLYDADGRLLRPVSPDGWAVTALDSIPEKTVDAGVPWVLLTGFHVPAGGTLLDPIGRQVLRVSLRDGRFEQLAAAAGTNTSLLAPRSGLWVHTWSSADLPERAEVRGLPGRPALALPAAAPSRYDPAALPKWEFLVIPGPGRTQLPAQLLKPAGFDPSRRYPVVIYHYGGPGSQTVIDRWDRRRRGLFHKRLAELGFAVLTVDGPSTLFFGKAGEDLDHHRLGEENLAAQLAGVEWLKTQRWADTDRLGLWGWSGGGSNTLYCLLKKPGVWKAGVAGAPVTDWRLYDSVWTERYMGTPERNPEAYRDTSPLTWAEHLKDHLLIVHGLADDNVHAQNSVQMIDQLVKAGRPVEAAFYPGEKHAMKPPAMRHFFERMEAFFVRVLQPYSP